MNKPLLRSSFTARGERVGGKRINEKGRVVSITGAVVDIEFERGHLPEILMLSRLKQRWKAAARLI